MDLLREVRPLARAWLVGAALLAAAPRPAEAEANLVSVSGYGIFGNADLRDALRLLEIEQAPIDARKIDDGAFLLLSRLKQSGYLDAAVDAEIETMDGDAQTATWSGDFEPQLPPETRIRFAKYTVRPNTLFYIDAIEFQGLHAMPESEARNYFVPAATLVTTRKQKAYSPSIATRAANNLAATLASMGYADATATATRAESDPEDGATRLAVVVEEGPRYQVTRIHYRVFEDGALVLEEREDASEIFSRFWLEDAISELRRKSYHIGFPNTRVFHSIEERQAVDGHVELTLLLEVRRNKQVYIDSVEHIGATDTRVELLERRARLEPGSLLDITEVERARRALSRLGIFDRVDLSYEDVAPQRRKVIFNYENGERVEWQLLAGWGSYEQGRVGIIGNRSNLFGRAQSASFEAIKSFKSTSGKATYSVPALLGEFIDGTAEINYLDREEISFDRRERGASVGISTFIEDLDLQLALGYAFDLKSSSDPTFSEQFRLEEANIGSVSVRASRKRIDNVLYPTRGYEAFVALRYAAPALGGDASFHREEIGASYHSMLGSRWIFHAALKASFISSPGNNALEIPFGERFLVGGENTVRGYQRGEAGPTDEEGNALGAEAFVQSNLELEYPLLGKLNTVVFLDSARVWDSTGDFAVYSDLYSAGLGLRYRTVVGPIRLEYGHNLNPRPADPNGTLHFSIGFPF